VDKQLTWRELPEDLRQRALIVCPQDEIIAHRAKGSRRLLVSPVEGISAKLQWIAEYAWKRQQKRICIVHDDVQRFHQRKRIDDPHLKIITGAEITAMFDHVEAMLNQFPMVGLAQRGEQDVFLPSSSRYNRSLEETLHPGYVTCQRLCTVYALDLELLRKESIRFDAVTLMEDFHLNLSLLERGFSTAIVTQYTYQQKTGTAGGCAIYRTPEVQREACIRLEQLHRPFVKIVKKHTTGASWEGMTERWDVNCFWAAAAKSGKQNKRRRLF
jgi:hypothetical protein